MELTATEIEAKNFIEGKFIPALHEIITSYNPAEYKKWGGNACKQAAIFGSVFLKEMLPNYQWTVWEGQFNDIVNGKQVQYNHAWLYGVDKKEKRRLLVDASRNHHERLFIEVSGNRYPKDHPSYINMQETERQKLDLETALTIEEYYTKLNAADFLAQLRLKTQAN